MQELGVTVTEDDAKYRIKAICITYMADLRRVQEAAKSGTSADDLYQPTCLKMLIRFYDMGYPFGRC